MDPQIPMLRPGVNVKTLRQNTKRGVHGPQKTNVETRCQCEDITTEHKEGRSWTPRKPMLRPGVNVKTLQQNTKRGIHGSQKTKVETRCQCEDITTEHKEGRSWTPENQC